MRWEPFEPRSPNDGAGHSADAVKKAVSPGLEWRSWRTTGSQSRESFIRGPTSVSPSGTRGKSRMHKGARTDPCGGRGVTRAPTATKKIANLSKDLECAPRAPGLIRAAPIQARSEAVKSAASEADTRDDARFSNHAKRRTRQRGVR